MDFIEIFKNKFCFIGCDILIKNISNYEKKIMTFQNNHEDAILENWEEMYELNGKTTKCFAIKTGKVSGITVLDFDTEYAYNIFLKNVPNFDTYFTVKTKKGWHVYCLYHPNLKTENNILNGYIDIIDIRNDSTYVTNQNKTTYICNVVICPPTSYIGLDGELFTYTFLGGEIKEVPQFLFDSLLKLNKQKYTFTLVQDRLLATHDKSIMIHNKQIAEQETRIAEQETRIKLLEQTINASIQKE